MKTASAIARYLAGVIFLVFGLNGFLNFIPLPPPGGIAGQFIGALYASHYLWVIFASRSGRLSIIQHSKATRLIDDTKRSGGGGLITFILSSGEERIARDVSTASNGDGSHRYVSCIRQSVVHY